MKKIVHYNIILLLLLFVQLVSARKPTGSPGLWTLDISHDDKYIALGGDDSLLRIFTGDLKLFKAMKTGNKGMIRAVSWHPKQNILAVAARNDIWIINPETNAEVQLEGTHGGSRTIAWNHDGELLGTAGGGGIIWIWDRHGKLKKQIQKRSADGNKDNKDFLGVDWHPSKNILVTVGDEIRIFDTTGKQLNVFLHRNKRAGILTVKWHPSGEFFVTGDYGHPNEGIPTLLQFWQMDGKLIKEWNGSQKELRNIRWNKQGTALATGSDALRIWTTDGELLHTGNAGENTVLWGVDWTSDSKKIFTVSFNSGKIQSWDNKGKLLKTYY
jgi:WD40 repeat protein